VVQEESARRTKREPAIHWRVDVQGRDRCTDFGELIMWALSFNAGYGDRRSSLARL
jgi:hypothetical protein